MNDTCQDGIRCQCGTGVSKCIRAGVISSGDFESPKSVVRCPVLLRVRETVRAILEQGVASIAQQTKKDSSDYNESTRRSLSRCCRIQTMTQMKTE
jgi:hypothetical protein